ncbi:ndk [Lepeophtheirus salmonis]|uniref:Nucleoside diphosphate kinase n=1 Tax=Lepeophtheirus salmonis TaxID=72036 RepID=C1BVQ7_LEPSM|nr:Nucleoside diphosphate kinase 6 [Lepeophtheirus salmonis]ADD24328.1 Nucleoside diphosphate kinase 6 [Lepeophtheirus salmonis]CAB4068632.1 ndk [Lepeophtheirus salmonis]CAF3012894.1 ndk [Lepeophtheirus salmonis]
MNTKTISLTLAIIKPDIAKIPYIVQSIRHRILDSGFVVLRSASFKVPTNDVRRFYSEHEGKFFYNRLTTFMSSGTSHLHVLGHTEDNAISLWRELMGPTKVFRTRYEKPNTIRGKYGLTDTRNGVHGSDSVENACREISLFFPDFDFEKCGRFTKEDSLLFDVDNFVHYPVSK